MSLDPSSNVAWLHARRSSDGNPFQPRTLRESIGGAPIGYLHVDWELRCADINAWLAAAYGSSAPAVVGRMLGDVLPTPSAAEVAADLAELIAQGGPAVRYVLEVERAGEKKYLQHDFSPVMSSEGRVRGIDVFVCDVDQPVRTQEQFRANDAKYRALVESALEGIVVIDEGGRILEVNAQMARMLGRDADELVGASKRDLVAVVRGAPAGPKLHRHRLAGRSGDREEWYWRHHDGSTIPTSVASRPLVDRAGRRVGTLLSIADMSERRELESQLGRVQELVEAGELSARLAHEVEGCIAAVIADLERLELSAGAERTLRARAQAAVETARRGEALAQRLLAASRRQVARRTRLQLLPGGGA